MSKLCCFLFFFFNDTATTEIYTLSLHDALPIFALPAVEPRAFVQIGAVDVERVGRRVVELRVGWPAADATAAAQAELDIDRSEEHTSELQSHLNLVCRLLLEKKKNSSGLSRRAA